MFPFCKTHLCLSCVLIYCFRTFHEIISTHYPFLGLNSKLLYIQIQVPMLQTCNRLSSEQKPREVYNQFCILIAYQTWGNRTLKTLMGIDRLECMQFYCQILICFWRYHFCINARYIWKLSRYILHVTTEKLLYNDEIIYCLK